MLTMNVRVLAFLVAATTLTPALAQQATLEVSLNSIQHDRGSVRVGLYSDPKTFRKEAHATVIRQAPAQAGRVAVSLEAVPPGRYAIMAYHDEDGNGELNRRFGMFPTEGYGLSNNPKVLGPPAFEDSAFEVPEGATTVRLDIDIRY